jgi:hypothetical protein
MTRLSTSMTRLAIHPILESIGDAFLLLALLSPMIPKIKPGTVKNIAAIMILAMPNPSV